jgi:hypothetical protein
VPITDNRRLRMDQEVATATRGRVQLVTYINSVRISQDTQYISVMLPETLNIRPQRRSKVKVEVTLRPSVSRPICLGVRAPGNRDQFFFLLDDFFRHFRVLLFCSALSEERMGL